MEFEKLKFNLWDVVTMIPIFICAFIVNNSLLSFGFILMGVVGFIHHIFINTYRILILDTMSIAIMSIIATIVVLNKIPSFIKDIIYFIELSVLLFLLFCFVTDIRYPNRLLLIIMSLIWLPLLIFSVKYLSHASGFIALITVFLYTSSVTICGENAFIKFSWPLMHVTFAVFAFLVLYELELIRPEVCQPIENTLKYITSMDT